MIRLGVVLAVLTLVASLASTGPATGRAAGTTAQRPARAEAPAARPQDPRPWLRHAGARARAGALWEAIDDATRAIEVDPTHAAAFVLRARLWRRLDVADMAIADLERALELRPTSRTIRQLLAAELGTVGPAAGAAAAAPQALDPRSLPSPRPLVPAAVRPGAERPAAADLRDAAALDALVVAGGPKPSPRALIPASKPAIDPTALDVVLIASPRPAASPAQPPAPQPDPAPTVAARPRGTDAPPPRIYRGAEIPSALGRRVGMLRGEAPGIGGPFVPPASHAPAPPRGGDSRATVARSAVPPPARPILPPRRRVAATPPASFDATPADPMREDLVAVPRVRVEQQRLP